MGIAYNTSLVRDGLVLHLDAANKKSYPGTGTTWADMSGSGNNGTLVNGVAYNAANKGSMTFDGVNDYTSLNKQIYNNTDDFTISTFIKSNSTQNTYSVPISQGHFPISGSNAGFAFQVGFPSASDMGFILGDGSWRTLSFSYSPRTDLSWNHLTVTKNGNLFTTFKNNIQIASASFTMIYGNFNFTIGMDTVNTGRNWNGNISNIQLYNRALTSAEITKNFNTLRGRYGI